MLSLRELRRAARILKDQLAGSPLRRVRQADGCTLVLTFDAPRGKTHVLLSCHPDSARVCRTGAAEAASQGSFGEYARAHLAGCVLKAVEASETDRQVCLRLQSRSESFSLILSVLGARSNLYLLDGGGVLVHAMRPLEETRRTLKIGGPWSDPPGRAPTESADRWDDVPDEEYLERIGRDYERLVLRQEAEALARRIEQALKKELSFLGRKAVNLQEDLGEARQAELNRRQGELLKNVLHTVRAGDDRAVATDFETGEAVEIPLDPRLSPAANLESYFARYQKEVRGEKIIRQQLEDLMAARSELEAAAEKAREAMQSDPPDREALEALASLPAIRRLLNRLQPRKKAIPAPAQPKKKRDLPARLSPKRYRTEEGMEIWVGRNDEGNDYLTTRLARGNDLFFHLEGCPGSHVVLRTEGRADPPPRALLDACELAVHFSRLKNAGTADVHMAPIKNVRKPKGAKPGLVYVRGGKSIRLRRDPKRLQELLAARLDD